MNHGVQLAKGYNRFLMMMLAVQFVILVGIIIALAYLGADSVISIITIVSSVSLMVLCLPLSALQFLSARERTLKTLFAGLMAVFFLMSQTVICWYLAEELPGLPWLSNFGTFLTLLSYVPIIIALLAVSGFKDLKTEQYNKAAIVLISTISALVVAFFTLGNAGRAGVDAFLAFNYTTSIIFDIAILALTSMLVLTYMQGKLRYLLSIILITYLASTVADFLMLVDSLAIFKTYDMANLVYAVMVNVSGMALLAYSLGNIKVVTVEEVSKKLDDVTLLMSDLVEQSPLAICMCDTAGIIVTANDRFLDICARGRQEVAGKLSIGEALPEAGGAFSSLAGPEAGIDAVTVDGLRIERTDKSLAYFRMKVFPTRGSEGSVSHIVVILDDVTERKAFEDQLVCAKKQTDLYVDLMGHDVNNMNQIAMGFLELAEARIQQEGVLGKDDLFLISKPIEALAHNSRIIYNIRKLQQEKAGAYRHEPVDVGPMLAGLTSRYSGIAGRDVMVSLRTGKNCTVMANELLGEVFDNLVGNAVKHTNGPVRIDIGMDKISEDGRDYCRVTVEDNGRGINDEMKAKLFDRLSLDCKRASGSGFGLCLSKILVEDFGGRLEVENRIPGDYAKGARFVVTLPLIGGDIESP